MISITKRENYNTMTKRLIDYDVENAITPVWVNSSTDMQRHEFKQLRREWKKDIKKKIEELKQNNQMDFVDYDKHYGGYQVWLTCYLWLEIVKFKNQLGINQVLQLLEDTFDFLEPIYQKIIFVKITISFDFVDMTSHIRMDKMRKHLMKTADYSHYDFLLKYKWMTDFMNADGIWGNASREELELKADWIKNNKIELDDSEQKDLEYIENNDLIIAYRGFLVRDDNPIRVLNKEGVEKFNKQYSKGGYDGSLWHYMQNEGFGVSYTLDKFVAHYFTFYADWYLQDLLKERYGKKVRLAVGEYLIRKEDIFTYTDARHEREIILRQSERRTKNDVVAFLKRYEFFTNGEGKFDRTGGYYQGDETRPTMLKYDYANDRKIMNTFRKVA